MGANENTSITGINRDVATIWLGEKTPMHAPITIDTMNPAAMTTRKNGMFSAGIPVAITPAPAMQSTHT